MANQREINWIDMGVSAMAVTDNIMKHLTSKGLLSPSERAHILDTAITELSVNPQTAKAADNIRIIFNRP